MYCADCMVPWILCWSSNARRKVVGASFVFLSAFEGLRATFVFCSRRSTDEEEKSIQWIFSIDFIAAVCLLRLRFSLSIVCFGVVLEWYFFSSSVVCRLLIARFWGGCTASEVLAYECDVLLLGYVITHL